MGSKALGDGGINNDVRHGEIAGVVISHVIGGRAWQYESVSSTRVVQWPVQRENIRAPRSERYRFEAKENEGKNNRTNL